MKVDEVVLPDEVHDSLLWRSWVKTAAAATAFFEQTLKPAPYLLGREMTALDMYAAMLSRWEPGRAWVDEQCRQVASALALTEQDPIVARVWERNFKR